MLEHDPKGVPIVEQLARERTGFLVLGLAVSHAQIQEPQELRGKLLAQPHARRPFAGGVDGLHDRLDGHAQRLAEALPLAV
ncbi:MAG: hypothetical protein WCA32_04315 [Chromatiaceae bacterium]|jgi:hypothetical protein